MCFMLQTSLKWMTPAPAKEVSKYLLFLQPFSGCCDASLKTCHLTEHPPLPSPLLSSPPRPACCPHPPVFPFLVFSAARPQNFTPASPANIHKMSRCWSVLQLHVGNAHYTSGLKLLIRCVFSQKPTPLDLCTWRGREAGSVGAFEDERPQIAWLS